MKELIQEELIKKIDEMFSDRKNVGISLSTIYKRVRGK